MSAVVAVSVSDPFPVQPLTVKVLPPAVSVRLAVVIPLKVSVRMPVTASELLVKVTLATRWSTRVSDEPVSDPVAGPAVDSEDIAAGAGVGEVGGGDSA